MTKKYNTSTICVQGGYEPKNGESRVVPIVQSTTFKYESSEKMGDLFDLKDSGYFYTRLANPTNDAVANKICQLEGGVAAILTSSGQAANFYAILNIASAGDHIISTSAIYGGTYNLIANTMKNLGIESTFVDPNISVEELESKFKPNTKLIFGETLSNPSLNILDIEKFAKVAHKNGVPLIVDNTFPTPIFCRPFEWGADIVTHSTTKYMNGSANAVGGAVVDSGNFDWTRYSEKYPGLTTPDKTYHGTVYTESFGKGAYITKMTTNLMRDLGSIPSPQNSFYLGVGLETLHLRMERHFENAFALAKHLEKHPKVSWISFSGLENDSQHELAQKYLPNGSCGVISFGIKGGREAAVKFMDSLRLAAIVTHVADTRTCVLHPASTTHRQMNDEELIAAGVSPDLIRLSVGIEDIRDLIDDIDQALEKQIK
ncbi:O-acetylhomoserine aminocarboxypropyltransferase/cysteine synthase family protein [Parvimonas micra]